MDSTEIRVTVVRYPDRRFLMMRYTDPVTGKQKTRSTRQTTRRAAERAAAKWEAELQAGRYHPPSKISFEEFRERYENEKLAALSARTAEASDTALDHLERILNPKLLRSITATTLSHFQAELRKTGVKETSIATYLRHVRAALSWGVAMQMLPEVPDIQMPKRAKGRTLMRGRPLTQREFENMLAAAAVVRPLDGRVWIRYLTGLWLSGLRLEESLLLSWDDASPIQIDLSGKRPRLRIYAEAEKGHQDRLLPMTPDFAAFLLNTPQAQRHGPAFQLLGLQTRKPITPRRVSRIISRIGHRADVIVNAVEKKYASAHDMRRSFGTRWSQRVKPATLQLLMRHRSIETTLKYYVQQDADEIAEELWRTQPSVESTTGAG